jgi:hypothetical protein
MNYQPLISQQIRLDFYSKFSKRVKPILDLYESIYFEWLKESQYEVELPPSLDLEPIEDVGDVLMDVRRVLAAKIEDESVKDWMMSEVDDLRTLSRRWKMSPSMVITRDLHSRIGKIIVESGAAQDIFIMGKMVTGPIRPMRFRKATDGEEALERLKKTDPEMFARIQGSKE